MKKLIYFISILFIVTGCSLKTNISNSPTKVVEEYLDNYQILTEEVLDKINNIAESEIDFDEEQKEEYKDLIKKHYQDLTYKIKDETVNGDSATVEVEIEVNDYTNNLKELQKSREDNLEKYYDENGNFDNIKYNKDKIEAIKSSKERVKYTLYLSLNNDNGKWILNDLTDSEEEKLLGIYEY